MLPRPSVMALIPALVVSWGCSSPDQTLEHEKTPTPGAPTDTPDTPTPEQIAILRVEPSEVDFGTQGIGCRIERKVSLHNDGGGNLIVYSAALSIASSIDFEVPDGDLITVPPRESYDLGVVYDVAGSGEDTGTLLIQSNDQEQGTVTIGLKGKASANIPFSQTFTQQPGGPVDILLALDVTSYATEYVGGIPLNLNSLVALLNASGIEWQMGWLSTDPVDGAELHGEFTAAKRPYITWEDTQADIDAFKTSIAQRLAAPATSYTPGLQMINAALSGDVIAGPNAGFMREGALLNVVVASVNDDESVDAQRLPVSIASLAEDLVEAKGDASLVAFDAIVGERTGSCAHEMGQRYIQMADEFGGLVEDICFQVWDQTFETLNREVQRLATSFVLNEVPEDPNGLVVEVDGFAVERDPEDGYTYDAATNAVVFHGDAIPAAGSQIHVSFDRGGDCHD